MRSRFVLAVCVLSGACSAPTYEPEDLEPDDDDGPVVPGEDRFDEDEEPKPLGPDLSILGVAAAMLESGVIHGHVAHLTPWLQSQGVDLAGVQVVNDGDRDAQVDVTVRLPDYGRPVTKRFDVPADGEPHAFFLSPDLDLSAIYGLRSTVTTNLTMVVKADGDQVSEQLPMTIVPRTRMPWEVEEPDGTRTSTVFTLATFVQPDSDAVAEVIAYARDFVSDGSMAGYQGSNDVYDEVNAVWETMYALGIGYSNIPGSFFDGAQRVRLHDEVLRDVGANCVDGAIFFAAVFEQLGLRPIVFVSSTHAWVGVYLSDPDLDPEAEFIPIETTLVGSDEAYLEDAIDEAYTTWVETEEDDPALEQLDVVYLHEAGIVPMPY
jgi:hypothetical protein